MEGELIDILVCTKAESKKRSQDEAANFCLMKSKEMKGVIQATLTGFDRYDENQDKYFYKVKILKV